MKTLTNAVENKQSATRAIWEMLGVRPPKRANAVSTMLDARKWLAVHPMPYGAIHKIESALHVGSTAEISSVLGIPERTLNRRKEKGVLDFNESVVVFMAAELFQRGVAVLGNPEAAAEWFKEPNRAIEGERPMNLLGDDIGRKLVEDLLGRIEHGIYE